MPSNAVVALATEKFVVVKRNPVIGTGPNELKDAARPTQASKQDDKKNFRAEQIAKRKAAAERKRQAAAKKAAAERKRRVGARKAAPTRRKRIGSTR